ncbi:outer membrane protein OprM [Geobacter sp. OR-1]|uniref:TolC family protein n=1 Tax=Geobacter sp. OR-1 TaxID=1266765 RepID=UPI0005444FED|nr:TolC family protein [Geobacter sp. OR-1]GAM09716.1 outer membrane protein OprM [Geobacter sp. OR-1]
MRLNKSLMTIAFLSLAGTSSASETLGLKEAVTLALEKNHLIKAATSESAAARAGLNSSRARYLPRVTFKEEAVLTNSGTRAFMMKLDEGRFSLAGDLNHPATTGDFQTSFGIEQPIVDLNLLRAGDVAGEELAARGHALEKRRQEIAFRVYAAYLDVQRSKAQLSVAEQAVNDAREHRRIAGVRRESGVGLKFDELRIGTFLAELEQQQITAENEVNLARLRLGQIAGLPAGAAPDISEMISAPGLTMMTERLEKEALANRADLKESTAEVARGDAGIAAVRGSYWPTLYASGRYQMNDRDLPGGRDNDSWMVGATLRWEMFDTIIRKGDLEKAKALRDAGVSYQNALRQEIGLQIRESLLRRTEAAKRLEVSRSAVHDAVEMVRLVNRRFESDLATAVELLDAQTALNRARGGLADNEANFALATARVYHNAGLFLQEVVK